MDEEEEIKGVVAVMGNLTIEMLRTKEEVAEGLEAVLNMEMEL